MTRATTFDVLRDKFAAAFEDAAYKGRVTRDEAIRALDQAWLDWHAEQHQRAVRDVG